MELGDTQGPCDPESNKLFRKCIKEQKMDFPFINQSININVKIHFEGYDKVIVRLCIQIQVP